MASIDGTPQVCDITWYGGDTLPVEVRFPPGYVAGRLWSAQVRSTAPAAAVDATFQVQLGATEDDPILLLLPASVTRALVTSQIFQARRQELARSARAMGEPLTAGDPLTTYNGVWDCQLAPAGGGDPTTTVVRGKLTITLDVTRAP